MVMLGRTMLNAVPFVLVGCSTVFQLSPETSILTWVSRTLNQPSGRPILIDTVTVTVDLVIDL
jgi:hypothetical protein